MTEGRTGEAARARGGATCVVVAPDSFKGTIGAAQAAAAIAAGWRSVRPSDVLVERPMADGGEGTVDAFERAVPGSRRMPVTVHGPDGREARAHWLLLADGTGVVELASTSGIEMLGDDRRPWDADTRGFGEAIASALTHGIRRLVLGIGSSASTDGGIGMLSALGARFVDASGEPITRGARGLEALASVDLSVLSPLPPGGAVVVTDVDAPLCGARGAAAVFGPQKGLGETEIPLVDAGLARFATLVAASRGGVDAEATGAGAAGGTGFGLLAWGATLAPGAAEVARLIGLDEAIAAADLVITGEGSYDGQSAAGKAPAFVAGLARSHGVPTALVAGRISGTDAGGFAHAVSLTALAGSAEAAIASPEQRLRAAGAALAAAADTAAPADTRAP